MKIIDGNQEKITSESNASDVASLLGEPYKTKSVVGLTFYYYRCLDNSSKSCTIRVDFINGKAYKIGWLDMNRFAYRKNFKQDK